MTGRRLLLLSPSFHGYWRSIERAFTDLGYQVVTHRYDAHDSLGTRLEHQLRHELPHRLGRNQLPSLVERTTRAAQAAYDQVRPDLVLVVKGDLLDPAFLEDSARRGPLALWLYDELRRTHHRPETLAPYRGIASYSRGDTAALAEQGHRTLHVPLAYDPTLPVTPRHGNELVFVGARYPRREELLVALVEAGVRVRAYGRDWSTHPVDRLRSWRMRRPPVPSGRDVGLAEGYDLMAGAPATVNIHGDQDGFTMRTFEAAGVGAVQLIDRAEVAEFYQPDVEVAVFEGTEQLIDLAVRAAGDDRWGDGLRNAARARTLAEHTFVHRARVLVSLWG